MDLPTYTSIWRIEKRLYKLYDFRLPMPLPVVTFGVCVGIAVVWIVLMRLLGVPFEPPVGHVIWIIPPILLGIAATRPVVEGKRLTELLLSQVRYLAEARVYCRLAPEHEPDTVVVAVRVWHRDPAAGPLPTVRRKAIRRQRREAAVEERAPERVPEPLDLEPARAEPAEAGTPERAAPRETAAPARAARAPVADAAPATAETRESAPALETGAGTARPASRSPLRWVLDYLGIGVSTHESETTAGAAKPLPAARRRELATVRRREEAPRPFPQTTEAGPPAGPDRNGDGHESGDGERAGTETRARILPPEGEEGIDAAEERSAGQWFAALRQSTGETPWQLSSKGAYSRSDTAPMPSPEPERRTPSPRQRAEEIMAAAHPAEAAEWLAPRKAGKHDTEEPPATGDERTTTAEPATGTAGPDTAEREGDHPTGRTPSSPRADSMRRLRGRAGNAAVARERERERERLSALPPPTREPVRGYATPAPPAEAPTSPSQSREPRRRPHAAPWELPPIGAARSTAPPSGDSPPPAADRVAPSADADQSDTAGAGEPAGAASEPERRDPSRAAADAPPPSAEPRSTGQEPATGGEPPDGAIAGPVGPAEPPQDERGEDGPRAAADSEPDTFPSTDPMAGVPTKPPLEIDHGTDAHAAFSHRFVEDSALAPSESVSGEEKGDKKGEAVSGSAGIGSGEGGDEGGREAAAAGTGISGPAGDAASAGAVGVDAVAESTPQEPKPPLEIDHGTGAQENFSDAIAPTRRPTIEEIEAAELAAFRARQRRASSAGAPPASSTGRASLTPAPDTTPAPATPGAENREAAETDGTDEALPPLRRSERLSRGVRSAPSGPYRSAAGPRAPEEPPTPDPGAARPAGEDGEEDGGILTRMARGARGIGQLLTPPRGNRHGAIDTEPPASGDTPADGEAASAGTVDTPPKPELQLDHGTGEQNVMSATHRGPPADGATGRGRAGGTAPDSGHHGEDGTGHASGAAPRTERDSGAASRPTTRGTSRTRGSDTSGTRGWRRLARVVTGGNAAPKADLPPAELTRVRTPINGSRRVVVLGCTGGAGQTLTTLVLGHTLAQYRDERIVAVDANPGPNGLSRRVRSETPETLTSLLANADSVNSYLTMREYTSKSTSGLEVVATLDDPYVQTLDDQDYAGLAELLERYYHITLVDPAATGVARTLPVADSLVLVAPASADAARAVAMTFEWLDGHGYTGLRSRAILVVNGVSKRSLTEVDAAEKVARGRCRAIVRVPWDDHVSDDRAVVDVGALRGTTRRAHAALAGVLATTLAAPKGKVEVKR